MSAPSATLLAISPTPALLDWLAKMSDAGKMITRGGLLINAAAADGNPFNIDAAIDLARAGLGHVDDLINAAWQGPSREHLAAASAEYRENRPAVVSPCAVQPKSQARPASRVNLTPRAVAERERLRAAWPDQWASGESAEIARRGPGREFAGWCPDARNAYFAAALTVVEQRRATA